MKRRGFILTTLLFPAILSAKRKQYYITVGMPGLDYIKYEFKRSRAKPLYYYLCLYLLKKNISLSSIKREGYIVLLNGERITEKYLVKYRAINKDCLVITKEMKHV